MQCGKRKQLNNITMDCYAVKNEREKKKKEHNDGLLCRKRENNSITMDCYAVKKERERKKSITMDCCAEKGKTIA